jgi:4-amino-4-deoxy-L-arabinose transferase-like glycosyltransferase
MAVFSCLGVIAIGLVGRRLGGPGVGLVAAAIAALDPLWVQWNGFLMSESLYLVIVPTMLLFAIRCLDKPTKWDFLALGVLVGIATLTRSEAVDFVVLLGVVVVILTTSRWRERMVFVAVFLVGVGLLLVPWLVRNEIQMGTLTLSTNEGLALSGSYSAGTFSPSSPDYGGFDNNAQFGAAAILVKFGKPPDHDSHWTELTLSDALKSGAIAYAKGHVSDLPGVALAREGRVWGVYAPGSELFFDRTEDLTGAYGPKQAEQIVNWFLLPLALFGAVTLGRRSRRRLLVVLIPVVVVALNAAVFYGSTRLRVAAAPSIDVLAAIGVLWVGGLLFARRRGSPVRAG